MKTATKNIIEIDSPLGPLRLRPEQAEDDGFRFQLFCQSRGAQFALLQLEPVDFEQLMRLQFHSQTTSYRADFPNARFDIIERASLPVGRIVVDRPGDRLHIVDQAIIPSLRNRGLGTAILQAQMDEAAKAGLKVQLKVASTNDAAMRLYQRLGFAPIATELLHTEMEWRATAGLVKAGP